MAGRSQRLGRGLAFPLVPRRGFRWAAGADAVAQSLRAILYTEPGERIGRPEFGVGLRQFLFAPNTVATRTLIRQHVSEGIIRLEPRIRLDRVEVLTADEESTLLEIHVQYRLLGAPGPENLVFPFYLDRRESGP